MLQEQVLQHEPNILSFQQRQDFFRDGFLVIDNYIPETWLRRLRKGLDTYLDQSRQQTESDAQFILEEGHTPEDPRLHRVNSPQISNADYWDFLTSPLVVDLVADVVGPDVKFHHAKLNVKSSSGSRGFKWHHDIPAWPHTDYSPVTFGVYFVGCSADMGPLSFVRGSNNGPLYTLYDDTGNYVIRVRDEDLTWLKEDMIERPTCGPGGVILLNCRTIHGSEPNQSNRARPLLLSVYSSADSFAYTANPLPSPQSGDIVRGQAAQFASFDTRPCELPPDFRAGYSAPWTRQKAEDQRAEQPA